MDAKENTLYHKHDKGAIQNNASPHSHKSKRLKLTKLALALNIIKVSYMN